MTEQQIVAVVVNVVASVSASLIVAAVTGLCVFFFSKRYASKLDFSGRMREFGFSEGIREGGLSNCELAKLFRENEEINMMYVSGNYLMEHIRTMVLKALARGAKVRFLLADPNGQFAKDVEKTELNGSERTEPDTVSKEILKTVELYRDTGVEIRFYSTEYRMPMILAYDKKRELRALLTLTLPPHKSVYSFTLQGTLSEKDRAKRGSDRIQFLETMEFHFNTVWDQSKDAYRTSETIKQDS